MAPDHIYDDLNDLQKAWLKKCCLHVERLDAPKDTWRVTVLQGGRKGTVLMRDLVSGTYAEADEYGLKLAYRASLVYCAGPQQG